MEDKKQDNRPAAMPGMSFNAPVTFNAPMFDIHDNTNVYINTAPDEQAGRRTASTPAPLPLPTQRCSKPSAPSWRQPTSRDGLSSARKANGMPFTVF